jgi:hypothetical protein
MEQNKEIKNQLNISSVSTQNSDVQSENLSAPNSVNQQYFQTIGQPQKIKQLNVNKNFSPQIAKVTRNTNTGFITKISEIIPSEKDLPVLSLIITLSSGSSYDELFTRIQQKAPEGGRISVYSVELASVERLTEILNNQVNLSSIENQVEKEIIIELLSDIKDLEPDCILFNFECCSGCHQKEYSFPKIPETFKLIKLIIDRGNYMMFSDFTVKALIANWDETLLGKNPFVKEAECSKSISLYFDPTVLKNCPSAQLQVVGELSSNGEVTIHALGGTIVFSIDQSKLEEDLYDIKILTIATNVGNYKLGNCQRLSQIKERKGTIGHVMLSYKKTGSVIFMSAGHWIELSNMNTDATNIENAAYVRGGAYQMEMESIKYNNNISEKEKNSQYQVLASKYVQMSAPCNYSKKVDYKSKMQERMSNSKVDK